ncbi:MAG: hypothetical protein A2X82_00735 [Geobacteraceae bacterium GWC2_55_20]|nr:MAG: hypothetical protein A2X82_00735 [Geobacteraceae bacterium GWC2_55_20]OGU18798.1 MAG: hypothetical protein A2X85_13810 [Geobacteraceae bacterium GWF2_54_21]HBA71115.1 hypothetical protein [Geobacter sp.]HCE69216.1 hypothetical protein [Geobacter sp.]
MKDLSAHSYDLKQAQQILNTFFSATASGAQEKQLHDEAPQYLRLSPDFSTRMTPRPPVVPVASPQETVASANQTHHQQFSSWEECIAWCMTMTRAESVFVADSQGFIIASRGRIPGHGFEAAGAEVICSVEQLERVAPDAGRLVWLDLDFDKYRVIGIITPPVDAEYYVVGFIAPDSSSFYSHKQIITLNILENLPNMD